MTEMYKRRYTDEVVAATAARTHGLPTLIPAGKGKAPTLRYGEMAAGFHEPDPETVAAAEAHADAAIAAMDAADAKDSATD